MREAKQNLDFKTSQLKRLKTQMLPPFEQRLSAVDRMLESLSFQRVLDRGFAVVSDSKGKIVTAPEKLASGDNVSITFKDDIKKEAVIQGQGKPSVKSAKRKPKSKNTDQQSLF